MATMRASVLARPYQIGAEEVGASTAMPSRHDNGGAAAPLGVVVVPDAVVAAFPGPAFCSDDRGVVRAANLLARPIVEALERDSDLQLRALLIAVAADRTAAVRRWRVVADGAERAFDLSLLPVGVAGDPRAHVLGLGRESSVDSTLLDALMESRQRYRDIVACSADFAWETDLQGIFRFVSPNGAIGYEAAELDGRPARNFLYSLADPAGPLPFESTVPLEDAEVWLRRPDGTPACMLVSSTPALSPDGRLLGARGVCRDVTAARQREAALGRARAREALARQIVDTIRNQLAPEDMFRAAARSTAEALGARHCWILRAAGGAKLVPAIGPESAGMPPDLSARLADAFSNAADGEVHAFTAAGLAVLAANCRHGPDTNGLFCVARVGTEAGWSEDDRALLASIAGHIGIAMAQARIQEQLTALSRTDELTGLFNRRAFGEEVNRRLHHLRRYGRSGVLLYCDLDNFKQVNDAFGHARGDQVLREFADILRRDLRSADMPARLGGDEFALWLEETDAEGATAKANRLLRAMDGLRRRCGDAGRPLSVSIGIAVADPGRFVELDDLLALADDAMYRAKQGGKNGVAAAGGPADAPSPEHDGC